MRIIESTTLVLLLALTFLGACASAPLKGKAVPEGVLRKLAVSDDAGAVKILRDASPADREQAYPVLYGEARDRFDIAEYAESASVLRVLREAYPDAAAVREAYAYALFLDRAGQEQPTPELVVELEESVAAIGAQGTRAPAWVHLVRAQTALDSGRTEDALSALAAFHAQWDGQPAALQLYVDDLERYIASH